VHAAEHANVNVVRLLISDKGALIIGVILAVGLAGMALMRAEAAADTARIAEREARVLQERVADMKVELIRRGIPLSDH
jgi:hypothetical protein